MKPINNWDNISTFGDREKLPVGAYQVVILGAMEKVYRSAFGEFGKLEISFDIAAGEHTGFYRRDYKNQNPPVGQERRWKGVLRLNIPKGDGTDADETSKKVLKGAITAIEQSNPGYRWDWNEAGLKGKQVGCIFRNEEWEYNGKTGWAVRPFRFTDINKVVSGDVVIPYDKPLAAATYQQPTQQAAAPAQQNPGQQYSNIGIDEDLPF